METVKVSGIKAPSYNPLFETFVNTQLPEAQVLPGMVAYCLYKIAKREWATAFFERHGRKPNDAELDDYIRTWTSTRIAGAGKEADAVSLEFAGSIIETNAPQIREQALRGTFWGSIWNSIIAAFLYTLMLIGLVIVLRAAGIDFLSILQEIGS